MGFGQAISSGFSNYVNFSDRAPRSEYWFWQLFFFLALLGAIALDSLITAPGSGFLPLVLIVLFGLILPSVAVNVRRLHDIDRSGWWVFFPIVPIIGPILLLIWHCTRGTNGSNQYGPDPLAGIAER
jgi:uncharacterized membrane protein YhaH (DUF805 family)